MSETARQTAERVVNKLLDDYSSPEEFEQRPGGPRDPLRQITIPTNFPKGSFSGHRPGEMPVEEPGDEMGAETGADMRCMHCGGPGPVVNGGLGVGLWCADCDAKYHSQGEEMNPHINRMKWRPPPPTMGEAKTLTKPGEGSQPKKAWYQGKIGHKTSASGAHSAMGNPGKAWRQGKIPHKTSASGARSTDSNAGKAWKQGKAAGGEMVASKPGKLSYKESLMRRVLENIKAKKAMKMGKGSKGKMVASKPGKVSYKAESHSKSNCCGGCGIKGAKKKSVPTVAKAPGKVSFGKRK